MYIEELKYTLGHRKLREKNRLGKDKRKDNTYIKLS
jgi:hypothetical protein